MIAYLDASAIGLVVFRDPEWERLERLTQSGACAISEFGWGELVSAISIRVRMRQTTPERASTLLASAADLAVEWQRLPLNDDDVRSATDLVLRFDLALRLPDAIHVAIARRAAATLVTADARQSAAARAVGITVFNPLKEPS